MRALSVKQPWAELIASGRKRIELRTWSTTYRGPLLICASGQAARSPSAEPWLALHDALPLGVAVCIVNLFDILSPGGFAAVGACCASSPREFGWLLSNPIRVSARAVKGKLGLYEVSF